MGARWGRLGGGWGLVLLLAVYALVYARAVAHDFVWDDSYNVVESAPYRAPLAESLRATQHDFLDRSLLHEVRLAVPYESYRPLLFLSYALDDALFARAAAPMHAHSLLLGALCIPLAWWVASGLLGDRRLGLAAAAVFALHPLQVEVLCYVSARGDLLCALFALLASGGFLAAVAAGDPRRRAGLSLGAALAFALSLAAKEASAALPLALGVWAWSRARLHAARLPLCALAAAGVLYAGLRLALVGALRSSLDGGNALDALASLPLLGFEYLRLFALPNDLSIERLAPPHAARAPAWLALAAGAAGALRALGPAPARWSASARAALVGLAWFALLLAPSALAVESFGVAADRYAALPLLGLGVAAAALAQRAAAASRVAPFALGAWATLALAVSAAQVSVWRDNESLYRNSLRVEPRSAMAHYRVGVLRARERAWSEALEHFERALALDADHVRALDNAGVAYLNLGRLGEAERVLARALALSGEKNFRAWNNWATLRFAQRRTGDACDALRRSLGINAAYTVARDNYARNCGAASPGAGAG